jgi:drug/metabolite transporter (DMT)-like permease
MSGGRAGAKAGHRRVVWLGLGLIIALDTMTQMTWKSMVMRLPANAGAAATIRSLLGQPLFVALLALIVASFFVWMVVISKADVSYAQPITALGYVSVMTLSAIYLGERLNVMRVAAVALILAGVWLIGTTPIETVIGRPARRTGDMGDLP